MDIRINSYNNFKGYDARPIRGFLMGTNAGGVASEMMRIGEKEGFKIFGVSELINKKPCIRADYLPETVKYSCFWAQDLWMVFKGKLFARREDETTDVIKNFFNLKPDSTQQTTRKSEQYTIFNNRKVNLYELLQERRYRSESLQTDRDIETLLEETHIPGGNVYIVMGDKGNEIIVGSNEIAKYSKEKICEMFDAVKVTAIPQTDYHIDLFMRPLDNKRILLADDNLSLQVLKDMLKNLDGISDRKYRALKKRLERLIVEFVQAKKRNPSPSADLSEKILKDAGYEVIRVPGNIYDVSIADGGSDCTIRYKCNYLNANALINKDGDLVYITNKSCIDSDAISDSDSQSIIDYNFQKAFINAVSPYIKPEHIYFAKGENDYVPKKMLNEFLGGIHCACSEVPSSV